MVRPLTSRCGCTCHPTAAVMASNTASTAGSESAARAARAGVVTPRPLASTRTTITRTRTSTGRLACSAGRNRRWRASSSCWCMVAIKRHPREPTAGRRASLQSTWQCATK
eukprot:Amastigsp_a843794_10.p5 type:complete len:111 gc:universal Amastigsp_a843794_10:393-725(+)